MDHLHETPASKRARDSIRSGDPSCYCFDREYHHHEHTEPQCDWADAIELIYREERALETH